MVELGVGRLGGLFVLWFGWCGVGVDGVECGLYLDLL